jgi:sugar phosphate isomerase/epimerase
LPQEPNNDKIVYFYHGIVNQNTYLIPRIISSLIEFPLIKQLFFVFPGIDQALNKDKLVEGVPGVEITPAMVGVFKSNWEINQKTLERLKQVNVNYLSFHAPYVNDGVGFQKGYASMLDNVFDLTEDTSTNLFCLISHLQVIEYLSPKKENTEGRVLVAHPLPASPKKSEKEIIEGTVKLVKKVIPLLKDLNIYLGIENMPWLKHNHELYTPMLGSIDFFEKIMNEINDEHVGITFDWGHANTYARYMYDHNLETKYAIFTPEYLQQFEYQNEFLKRLKKKIIHLHLNYNEAHILTKKKGPFMARNFDSHQDLTFLSEEEYKYYRKNIRTIAKSENLRSMVLETIPSFFNYKKRIGNYQTSVEILRSMIK